jgi:hypothetical protein
VGKGGERENSKIEARKMSSSRVVERITTTATTATTATRIAQSKSNTTVRNPTDKIEDGQVGRILQKDNSRGK